MIRFFGPGIFGVAMLCLWVYALFDSISTDESLVRNLPKTFWIMIIFFVPGIGSLAWLMLGRPLYAGWRPGDTSTRPVRPVVAPEDDPRFMADREAELRRKEAELRRREEELRRREEGDGS